MQWLLNVKPCFSSNFVESFSGLAEDFVLFLKISWLPKYLRRALFIVEETGRGQGNSITIVHPFQGGSHEVSRCQRTRDYRKASGKPVLRFLSTVSSPPLFLHLSIPAFSLVMWMFPGAIRRKSTIPASWWLHMAVLRLVWYSG